MSKVYTLTITFEGNTHTGHFNSRDVTLYALRDFMRENLDWIHAPLLLSINNRDHIEQIARWLAHHKHPTFTHRIIETDAKMIPQPAEILIYVDNGVVTSVLTNLPEGVRVWVADHDTHEIGDTIVINGADIQGELREFSE